MPSHVSCSRGLLFGFMLVLLGLGTICSGCGKDVNGVNEKNHVQFIWSNLNTAVKRGQLRLEDLSQISEQPDALNAYLTAFLVAERNFDESALLDRGYLVKRPGAQEGLLTDGWGRPIIFQVPDVFSEGLVYSIEGSATKIQPLPPEIWSSKKWGPIQVWSLGRNGIDDRGGGDDVFPWGMRVTPAK